MKNNWRQLDIRIYAVIGSVLVSAFTLAFPDSPNDDAYTYIKTAEVFLSEGLYSAYQHYEWASYSILMGWISLLGIDLFSAGLLLNSLFYAILVYSFVSIVKEVDNSKPLLALAAISILLYPQLNEYRYFIIRDVGFWAFSILALWQYIQFSRSHSIANAAFFCCSLLIAAIFRIEALVYLLLTPFSILLDTRYEQKIRNRLFSKLIGIAFIVTISALALLSILGIDVPNLIVGFVSVYEPFIGNSISPDEARVSELALVLFNEHAAAYSQEYITAFMAAGFLTILLANLYNAIGGPYLIILLIGFFKKHIRLSREVAIPLISYLVANTVILFVFLYVTRFLTSRYAMLFCILLALFVPLIVRKILNTVKVDNLKTAQVLLVIFFTYCAIDSYYSFGETKNHVFDSIEWLAENTDDSSALITNNHAIAYFSGKVEAYDEAPRYLSAEQILAMREGDTIAVELNYEMEQLLNDSSLTPYLEFLAAFPDQAQRRTVLYRRISP